MDVADGEGVELFNEGGEKEVVENVGQVDADKAFIGGQHQVEDAEQAEAQGEEQQQVHVLVGQHVIDQHLGAEDGELAQGGGEDGGERVDGPELVVRPE